MPATYSLQTWQHPGLLLEAGKAAVFHHMLLLEARCTQTLLKIFVLPPPPGNTIDALQSGIVKC